MEDYNHHRPHEGIGKIPSVKYAKINSSGVSPRRIKNNNFIEVLEN
jgi:putative transposase